MWKRIVAVIVMLLLIASAVLLGTQRSLSKMKRELDAVFENGVDGDGYSIQSDLDIIMDQSWNLLTVAGNYYSSDDERIMALKTAYTELSEAKTVGEKSAADRAVTEAVTVLYDALKNEPSLTDAHAKLIGQYYTEIQSRNQTIANDGYNDAARGYNEELSGFPAVFIAPLLGIEEAELF